MKCGASTCLGRGDTCVSRVPIFSTLTCEEMLEIAKVITNMEFKKDEIIYLSGDKAEKLYIINEGRVKISRLSEAGKEQIIRILGPGDFMGELFLFSNSIHNNNAQALERTVVCMIDGSKIKKIIEEHPCISIKILEELSKRLEKAENLIEQLGIKDVEQRIAETLLSMVESSSEVILSMSKKDFASHIGMSQETLSRKLSFFQEMGWIELIGHRKIIILDKESLYNIAKL